MNEAIVFENVCFAYDETEKNVVENLSFKVERGAFVALVGRNASGKSTVAKLVNGLIAPLSGKITVLGFDATDENNTFEIRKRCGIVFQNPDNQMVATIVEDDVAFGPENIGIEREEIGRRIDFALKATGTESFRLSAASKLSGGQKQRVAIAGVLAMKPEILILDESTSMLDPRGRREVMDVVKKLNKDGMTVVVITHYMDEVTDCDEVLVMGEGKLLKSGTPEEIFADEELLTRAGLELPVPAKIAKLLREKGVKIGRPLTKEALKDELCELLQGK
ncbi:MAG TPA: energy-coupling factor transporter ATPase [Clostridiales bacterium]|nr:energy-coupling factor transporter ATPase [Clostridiales bacterium]